MAADQQHGERRRLDDGTEAPQQAVPQFAVVLERGDVARDGVDQSVAGRRRRVPLDPLPAAVLAAVAALEVDRVVTGAETGQQIGRGLAVLGMNQFQHGKGQQLLFGITQHLRHGRIDRVQPAVSAGDAQAINRQAEEGGVVVAAHDGVVSPAKMPSPGMWWIDESEPNVHCRRRY